MKPIDYKKLTGRGGFILLAAEPSIAPSDPGSPLTFIIGADQVAPLVAYCFSNRRLFTVFAPPLAF